jgi:ABC-2 type transport system permease protein
MNPRRVYGVLLQEAFLTLHSLEVIVDVFVFPLVNIVIFGLISLYLSGGDESKAGPYVFLGMLLWQVIAIVAYSVAVGSMWNIWSRNLSNMFVSPLRVSEYVGAQFLSGCVKALGLIVLGAGLGIWFFDFNVFAIGALNVALVFVVLALFGLAIALVSLGLIFRFGTRLAALSWSLPWLFQPLSAAFFPLSYLPSAMQWIARALAPTYGFEAAREALEHGGVDWQLFALGLTLDFAYCAAAVLFFRYMFKKSKESGQLARNES